MSDLFDECHSCLNSASFFVRNGDDAKIVYASVTKKTSLNTLACKHRRKTVPALYACVGLKKLAFAVSFAIFG